MQFYKNQMFHIYNQGNNQRQVFFTTENYQYFLYKMRGYLLPFGDLIAWCLMPNHFHWQFFVKETAIKRKVLREHVDVVEFRRRIKKYGEKARPVDAANNRTEEGESLITLNDAIGDLLKGYTRAINKEKNWTGSLFREKCKAKDGWIDEFVTVDKNGRPDLRFLPGSDYGYQLMHYIHENAVEAKIVKNAIEYEWSSAKEYAGLGKGSLCNLEMGRRIMRYL